MSTQRKSPPGRRRKTVAAMPPRAVPTPIVAGPTLDLTEARARLTESVNRVSYRGERIVIQKHGRPVAALVPIEDLALLREIEDRIDLEDARKALADAKGKLIPWEAVKRTLGL